MLTMMSGSRFAGLGKAAQRLGRAAGGGRPAAIMSGEPAKAAGPSPGTATAERARVAAVFASDHSKGRERFVADMLATSMTAGEITALLAKAPAGAAGDAMLARLAETPNPRLGAGKADTSGGGETRSAADDIWARARPR